MIGFWKPKMCACELSITLLQEITGFRLHAGV